MEFLIKNVENKAQNIGYFKIESLLKQLSPKSEISFFVMFISENLKFFLFS